MIWVFAVIAICFASEDYDLLNETDAFNQTEVYNDTGRTNDTVYFDPLRLTPWPLFLLFNRLKLMEVDEPNEQVTLVTEVLQTWFDPRLTWVSYDHQNITAMYTRLEKVWSPPFTVFSASEVVEHRDQNYRLAKITNTGDVYAYIPMKIKTNCKLNMEDFPFDTQICEIRSGVPSLKFHVYEVFVSLAEELYNFCPLGNSAWDVINITAATQKVMVDSFFFDNTKMAVVRVHFKRNPVYYMYMIVLPTFIINSLSTAGVFLKNTDKIDRLTIGLTHIMTMTFILGIVADKLPKTEHIPFLGKYIIFSLATMIASLVISTYLKKICGFLTKKLTTTRSVFGQKLRKFIGSPLRLIFIIIFQTANVAAVIYILARWYSFEKEFGVSECAIIKKTMEIEPEIIMDCGCP